MGGRHGHGTTHDLFRVVDGQAEREHPLSGWGTENHGYRSDDFYIGSTDTRGHSQNMQVPLPTNIAGRVGELVQSKEFPAYRTSQDLIRDAVCHRLQRLAEMADDPEVKKRLAEAVVMERRASQIAQHARDLEARRELIENADRNLHLACAEQDWITVGNMISLYDETIDDLADPWRSRLEGIVNKYRDKLPR